MSANAACGAAPHNGLRGSFRLAVRRLVIVELARSERLDGHDY